MHDNTTTPARNTDPATSHNAARLLSTGRSQCLAILRAHATVGAQWDGLTDYEAATAADLTGPGTCWWHRCSDLRRLGLIRWMYNDDGTPITRPGVTGRPSGVSIITDEGAAELDRHDA